MRITDIFRKVLRLSSTLGRHMKVKSKMWHLCPQEACMDALITKNESSLRKPDWCNIDNW